MPEVHQDRHLPRLSPRDLHSHLRLTHVARPPAQTVRERMWIFRSPTQIFGTDTSTCDPRSACFPLTALEDRTKRHRADPFTSALAQARQSIPMWRVTR